MHADACHNLSGACACRHIDDGCAGKDLAFGSLIVFRDCGDDWNVNHQHGGFDGFRRSGRIDDNACRALHFGHHGQFGHTWTCGGATAHAYEQRHLGYGEQRLCDDRLAGERVDGENGVGIGVANDHGIGGIGERFERMAFDCDAAAMLRYDCGHSCIGGGEATFDTRGSITGARHVRCHGMLFHRHGLTGSEQGSFADTNWFGAVFLGSILLVVAHSRTSVSV